MLFEAEDRVGTVVEFCLGLLFGLMLMAGTWGFIVFLAMIQELCAQA